MAGRLDRFLNLEGARPKAAADSSPPAELQARRAAQLESGIAVDDRSDEVQPFVRCGQCGTDSTREAVRCPTCSSELNTELQRAFNQALWQKRRQEMALERAREHDQAPGAARLSEASELTLAQRELGEALAREVRERELERLQWMKHDSPEARAARPLGLRLLAQIPSQRWRSAAALSMMAITGVVFWQAMRRHTWLGIVVLVAAANLFADIFGAHRRGDGWRRWFRW